MHKPPFLTHRVLNSTLHLFNPQPSSPTIYISTHTLYFSCLSHPFTHPNNKNMKDIMRNQVVEEKFVEFYEKWVTQLDENLQLLLRASIEQSLNEAEQQALVSRMTTHIKEYYTVKWAMAREDVLVFYNPVWISTLESGYFWYTGWKPSSVFRLVESIMKKREVGPRLDDLTELQAKKIEELRLRIRLEEDKVDRDMERQQVTLADRKMMELSRLAARFRREGDSTSAASKHVDGLVGIALKSLMNGLEKVMKTADCMRLKTMKGILDNLNSKQSIEFLAANFMLQIQLRQCGKKRDAIAKRP